MNKQTNKKANIATQNTKQEESLLDFYFRWWACSANNPAQYTFNNKKEKPYID